MNPLITVILIALCFSSPVLADDTEVIEQPEADISDDVDEDEPDYEDDITEEAMDNWQFHSAYYSPQLQKKWLFHNSTKLGVIFTTGNSKSLTFDGLNKFTIRKGTVTNVLKGGGIYTRGSVAGTQGRQTTARYFFVDDKVHWEFSKNLYAYLITGWFSDRLLFIENNFRAQTGVGSYVLDTAKHTLQIESGYGFNREDRTMPAADVSLHSWVLGLDYTWQITNKAFLEQELIALLRLTNGKDFRFHSTTTFSVLFLKHLGMAVSVDVRFDNEPVLSAKKVDTTTAASLLVHF